METPEASIRALFAQHTVTRPEMGLPDAVARLRALAVPGEKLRPDAFDQRVAVDASVQDAAIAFIKLRFTPLWSAEVDADADYGAALMATLRIAPAMDATHKREFVEVLFNLAHPAHHQALWPAVLGTIPAAEMEQHLLARVRSENELHVNNALHMPYYIYGRRSDYKLSAAGKAELIRAIGDLEARPDLNAMVREGLAHVRIA